MPIRQPFPIIASYKEPWSLGVVFEHFYRFSLDLASTGASAALARTATAPLDRAKVGCATTVSPTRSLASSAKHLLLSLYQMTEGVPHADIDASVSHGKSA